MMLVIRAGGVEAFAHWRQHFSECAPALDVRAWDDGNVDPADIDFVVVSSPPSGWLASLPSLKLIFSAAAGVDHFQSDPELPAHIPIIRMVTPETAQRMSDYVCMAALSLIRGYPDLIKAQSAKTWRPDITGGVSSDTTVGIMGLGQLGMYAAHRLEAIGFHVNGWANSVKPLRQGRCFVGQSQFASFLASCDIVVNLLPYTPQTFRILNAEAFNAMRHGASLINVGRSAHVDHDALLAALDKGQLGVAMLDVFDIKPLPEDAALWSHPRVVVTPHIASMPSYSARVKHVAEMIQAYDEGVKPMPFLFDHLRGY